MNKILLCSPRQWNLQWGQEKDLINALPDYHITVLEFPDHEGLPSTYPPPKNCEVILRPSKHKPGVLYGITTELRTLRDTLHHPHDLLVTYLTAGSLLAVIADKIRGKKVLLIYADDLPEIHRHTSYAAYLATKYITNPITARLADKIVATTFLLGLDITPRGKETEIIPNGVTPTPLKPTPYRRNKKFTLGFVGGFGEWVDFDLPLHYAEKNPDVNILLVGDGTQYQHVKTRAATLPNVTLTGMVPKKEAERLTAQMDVCLIPFKVNRLTDRVSPIKLFEYWAAGKPVISTRCHEIVITGLSIVLFADNDEEFAQRVNQLRHDHTLYNLQAQQGLDAVRGYNWTFLGRRYHAIIDDLLVKA